MFQNTSMDQRRLCFVGFFFCFDSTQPFQKQKSSMVVVQMPFSSSLGGGGGGNSTLYFSIFFLFLKERKKNWRKKREIEIMSVSHAGFS